MERNHEEGFSYRLPRAAAIRHGGDSGGMIGITTKHILTVNHELVKHLRPHPLTRGSVLCGRHDTRPSVVKSPDNGVFRPCRVFYRKARE